MPLQGGVKIERMCALAGVSRAGFYRYLRQRDAWDEEMGVRSEVQKVVLEHQGRYGYRRVTTELRRRGMLLNHKRVARLIREDSLLVARSVLPNVSSDARGRGEISINLANSLENYRSESALGSGHHFVGLKREFVYSAVVLDKFSHRVVGWGVERTLTVRLPLAALQKAIQERRPQPGLVHHSDLAVQYARGEYLRTLQEHGMVPSLSRPGHSLRQC